MDAISAFVKLNAHGATLCALLFEGILRDSHGGTEGTENREEEKSQRITRMNTN